MSIFATATSAAFSIAAATSRGGPAKVSTLRLWFASDVRSSSRTARVLATAAASSSITSVRRPSLKLGTHSTRRSLTPASLARRFIRAGEEPAFHFSQDGIDKVHLRLHNDAHG